MGNCTKEDHVKATWLMHRSKDSDYLISDREHLVRNGEPERLRSRAVACRHRAPRRSRSGRPDERPS